MNTAWEEYWWNNITGPHQTVTCVAEGLLDKKTIILQVPSDLPWRHEMRRAVRSALKNHAGFDEVNIEVIDAADENLEVQEPGRYLLERFGMYDVKNGFRAKSGVTIQDYIIRNNVVKNTVVWIKGLNQKQTDRWVKLCRGYNAPDITSGLFVLECHQHVDCNDTRNAICVNYEDYVRRYDLQLFNSILLDSQELYSDRWKQYIATLAAHLCVTDAEVSEQFLHLCNFKHEEPLVGLRNILDCGGFDKRGADSNSNHILGLVRQDAKHLINKRIWAAQLQTLFPLIEMRRSEIITLLYDQLVSCLENEHINQFDQALTDPMDVELGTLVYMMARFNTEGYRFINVPNEQLRDDIHFLRGCRNTLAHGSICSVGMIERLFSIEIPDKLFPLEYDNSRVS